MSIPRGGTRVARWEELRVSEFASAEFAQQLRVTMHVRYWRWWRSRTRACARVHARVAENKIVLPDRCVRETLKSWALIAPIDLLTACWLTTTS